MGRGDVVSGHDAAKEVMEILGILEKGNSQDFELVKSLIDDFPQGVDPWIERNWITNAIDCHSLSAVQWMIEQGVELKFRDPEGYTVLHVAMEHAGPGKSAILWALIAAGADINAHGINDWTPLHMAVARGDIDALEILLRAGADRKIKTRIDHYATPEQEARRSGSERIANIIRDFKP